MSLATFDITKAQDEHGNVIEPDFEWMNGMVRYEIFRHHIHTDLMLSEIALMMKSPQTLQMWDKAKVYADRGVG